LGTGFGLRYDLSFVIRFDFGFKTYNPAEINKRWFRDYNFANSVLNFWNKLPSNAN
jgi:hypothetical protein